MSSSSPEATSVKKLRREILAMTMNPTAGITAHLKQDNLYKWEATIEGPRDSPYEVTIVWKWI